MNATDRSMLPHAPPSPAHPPAARNSSGLRALAILALVVVVGGGGAYWAATRNNDNGATLEGAQPLPVAQLQAGQVVSVDVIRPKQGGIVRTCIQPGTVEPFEWADLDAKVSGFLKTQTVDIGDHVKKGQVLATISVPEYEKQVERDQAKVKHANATVEQMKARLEGAKSEAKAAESQIKLSEEDVKSKTAYRSYREKQLKRFKELGKTSSIDMRAVDEKEDQYEASVAAEATAKASVVTAKLNAAAAKTKIDQAKADLDEAQAEVAVAQADLDKSQVLIDYMTIKSPYDGVITKRNFHPGDFIRDASSGSHMPLLRVERTDKVRVVVQVPDRDVAYVSKGDTVEIRIDALGHRVFKGAVTRWADAEDPDTRTMRTEIDLPNPKGELRRGMYGQMTITLEQGSKDDLRIPSAALVGKSEDGNATVRVIRNGHAVLVPIKITTDNGIETEVSSGLKASDQVVIQTHGAVDDKTPVQVANVSAKSSH